MKKNFLLIAMLIATAILKAQTNQLPKLKLELFSSGYTLPLGIENAGDGRLFIVEKAGKIWICNAAGVKRNVPFLDITGRVSSTSNEQGLLGLAFDPDYATNGCFYVHYSNLAGNAVISRFVVNSNDDNLANINSEVKMMTIFDPAVNHNGGCIRFGDDGYLYIAIGDGGGNGGGDIPNRAQNTDKLFGKILRIDVTHGSNGKKYSIPASNPFTGIPGFRPEIWATGLRNPWRFSFDKLNGNLWIGDVGQEDWEEINFQPAGRSGVNYGWSCWEGSHFFKENCSPNSKPVTFPIAEYEHVITSGTCSGSITGGFVYRGTQFPRMYGKYIYTDFCRGVFRAVYKDHGVWVNRYLDTKDQHAYTSFGEKKNGELYVTDYNTGKIYHVVDDVTSPRFVSEDSGTESETGDDISLFPNPNTGDFTVQLSVTQKENCTIIISDLLGREVLTETKLLVEGLNEWTFSSDKFINGIYVFQVKTAETTISKRFSVQ